MKKIPLVWHPLFFALYTVLAVIATDASLIFYQQAGRALWFAPALALVVMLIVQAVTKNWHRTGFLVTLGIFLVGYYGHIYRLARARLAIPWLVNHAVLFPLWALIIILLGGPWLWRHVRNARLITQFFNVVSIVVVALPSLTAFSIITQLRRDPLTNWTRPPDSTPLTLSRQQQPDIYYIIVDGYASAGILQEIYHFDNRELIQYLQGRGFYVAEDSRSNYPRTYLSLASSLNFEPLDLLEGPGKNTANWFPLHELIAHSRARAALTQAGYQFTAYSSGFFYTEVRDADRYLSSYALDLNEFEQLLLATTALEIPADWGLLPVPSFSYNAHRQRILYQLDHIGEPSQTQQPQFVFAHLLAPHPPFVFDAQGKAVESNQPYTMADGYDYQGTPEEYRQSYIAQLTYINARLQTLIDRILQNASSRGVVIILQGDHGPRMNSIGDANERGCFYERYAILNAYYLPGAQLYASISPVNSFRVVFNTLFGTQLELLRDQNYFSTLQRPYQFQDVTAESQIPCSP